MSFPDAPSSVETSINVDKLAALQECENVAGPAQSASRIAAAKIAVRCTSMLATAIFSGLSAVAKAIERRR